MRSFSCWPNSSAVESVLQRDPAVFVGGEDGVRMGLEQSPEASLARPDGRRLLEIGEACPEPLDGLLVLDGADRSSDPSSVRTAMSSSTKSGRPSRNAWSTTDSPSASSGIVTTDRPPVDQPASSRVHIRIRMDGPVVPGRHGSAIHDRG